MRVVENLLIARHQRELVQASRRDQHPIRRVGVKFPGQGIGLLDVFQVNRQDDPATIRLKGEITPLAWVECWFC